MGAIPTGNGTSGHSQPSESDVVDDHIRLGQHQIVAITHIGVAIGALQMKRASTTEGDQTVGCSSCGSQLSRVGLDRDDQRPLHGHQLTGFVRGSARNG